MRINVTASGNFDNKKTWSGVKKHMKHDPNLNHKNKYLNTNESKRLRKFNQHETLIDFEDFIKEKFQPYITEHDRNEKHKNKKYNSVSKFLEQKSRTSKNGKTYPVQLFVEKFSDMETFSNVYKQTNNNLKNATINGRPLTDDEREFYANKIFADGLTEYAQGFNKRNPNLKMFEYYIHMDEKGAPHLHAPVMPFTDMGKTNKGLIKQPSTSLNRALKEQYKSNSKLKTNQQRLSEFRKQEDSTLVDCINDKYESIFHERPFELVRKTDAKQVETGINHDEYIARQQAEERNRQLQINISNNEKILDKQKKSKKANQDKLDEQTKTIAKKQAKINVLKTTEHIFVENYNKQTKKIVKFLSKITGAVTKRIKAMGFASYSNPEENQKIINDVKDIPGVLRDVADNIEETLTMVEDYNQEMSDYVKKASEAKKTASKPLIKEIGKNTHVAEKDDGIEL